jgi:cytochrome c peroxidase
MNDLHCRISGLSSLRLPLPGFFLKAGRKSSGRTPAIILMTLTLAIAGVLPGASQAQVQTYTCTGGFGVGVPVIPPIPLSSLKTVPNPVLPNGPNGAVRGDLADYIANLPAAIRLGKALFWDMQAGSDNKTACATCHFQAGADRRDRNQLNPGADGAFTLPAPNSLLTSSPISPAYDDVAGSQGVRKSTFQGFSKSGAELTSSLADPVFNVNGVNVRQVTGKNTPPVINAVFNHRQFWNGRAQPDFNGVNPWGSRDTSARVWVLDYRGFPVQVAINIKNASLASQAVGPALNDVEMSAAGRSFPDLGKKLLLLKPLGLQKVDASDSALGPLADTTMGLKTTYTAMIKAAFQPKWWNSNKSVSVGGKSYTMMQANFSLYWGLAIMLYEATLVSDDTPMDQYLDPAGITIPRPPLSTTPLNQVVDRLAAEGITVTVADILNGLALFELPVRVPPPSFPASTGVDGVGCIGCHLGAELTSASMQNLTGHGLEPGDAAFKGAGFDLRMERMFMKLDWPPAGPLSPVPLGTDTISFDPSTYAVNVTHILVPPGDSSLSLSLLLPVATYDAGWYNIGVRPTGDDSGLGGTDPFGKFLSWTQYFQQTLADPTFIKVPGNGLPCVTAGNVTFPGELLNAQGFPLLSGPLHKNEGTDVPGSFKVPALRNAELNGPYFHNGGKATLKQVVEFYDDAGNFANATKAPAIVPLLLTQNQRNSLVAFLLALTDERVRRQKAPFDHPQLFVPNGDNPAGTDAMEEIPAVGASGGAALQRFLNLSPFQP